MVMPNTGCAYAACSNEAVIARTVTGFGVVTTVGVCHAHADMLDTGMPIYITMYREQNEQHQPT